MKREVPEPWAKAMKKAGMVDPRNGHPSWSKLGREIDVHPSTLIAMADGKRDTEVETIAKVAKALRVSAATIAKWIGEKRSVGDIYEPPAESRFLSKGEKDALTVLIKQIAAGKRRARGLEDADDVSDLGVPDAESQPS